MLSFAACLRWLLGEPADADATATAGMRTNPIAVNPDTGQRAALAFARLDAIKRTVAQKRDEGRAIDPERMAEYRAEVRAHLAFLLQQRAITEVGYAATVEDVLPGERL